MKRTCIVIAIAVICLGSRELAAENHLAGRLFDSVSGSPWSGAYVFALSSNAQTVYDWTTTTNERGANSGGWELTRLPAMSGDILLVGFHPSIKANIWIAKARLDGRDRALGVGWTRMGLPRNDLGQPGSALSLLALAGWIAREIETSRVNDEATSLADRLMHHVEMRR